VDGGGDRSSRLRKGKGRTQTFDISTIIIIIIIEDDDNPSWVSLTRSSDEKLARSLGTI